MYTVSPIHFLPVVSVLVRKPTCDRHPKCFSAHFLLTLHIYHCQREKNVFSSHLGEANCDTNTVERRVCFVRWCDTRSSSFCSQYRVTSSMDCSFMKCFEFCRELNKLPRPYFATHYHRLCLLQAKLVSQSVCWNEVSAAHLIIKTATGSDNLGSCLQPV